MRVLLTESSSGTAAEVETRLLAAGHEVSLCHPDRGPDDGCVALLGCGPCPLRIEDVDVFVDVRSEDASSGLSVREFGAHCALRHGVPLVAVGEADESTFPWWGARVCKSEELMAVCNHLARMTAAQNV